MAIEQGSSFAEGKSFDQVFSEVLGEAAGNQPPTETPPQEPTTQETKTEPAPTVDTADEIEYEGKKYKVEKSAKDYLKEMMDAKKGMRKAFAERDKRDQKIKEHEAELKKFEQLQSVFKTKGIEGLYDDLAGKPGSYQEMLKKREELAVRKYTATEEELRLIQQEELLQKERELRELAERTQKEVLENIQKKELASQTAVLSAKLNEAFETVSLEGKLGDEKREEKLNRYIWEQARMQLKEYAEAKKIPHHEIPSKEIKKVFMEVAADFGDLINKQVSEKITKQTQQTSDAATIAAQAKAMDKIPGKNISNLEELAEKHKTPYSFINALFG